MNERRELWTLTEGRFAFACRILFVSLCSSKVDLEVRQREPWL